MDITTTSVDDAKKASISDMLSQLSSGKDGLSSTDAATRLQQFGPNEIAEKKVNPLIKFFGYFWGPIPWMIEAAAALSAVLGRWDDFLVIFVLLLMNGIVGFWQEHKAENAIELLKQRLALKARVLRDGKWMDVEARDLVPGDVVHVRLGAIVPADIKLIDGDYLQTDESALTGESLPVEKKLADIAYSGSVVRLGEMDGLVIATGMKTYFGRTAKLVEEARTQSHFQKAVIRIGDYLILMAIVLVSIVILTAIYRHEALLITLQFALVLIVAAIPAALPAVLTVTMAVGATALAKKEAIVSKLVSIEEMAGVDILCADKTGTITKNDLTVGDVKPLNGFKDEDVLLMGTLASSEEGSDIIDNAIITHAKESGKIAEALTRYKSVAFKPFDPVSKKTEAKIEDSDGKDFQVAKGAPQVILSLAADRDSISSEIEEIVDAFASKGYRALGVARTDPEGKWHYVGLIALYDPPREDSAETIKSAREMGVEVKMVTGDHVAIAREIAKRVDLGTNIILSSDIVDKPDEEAEKIIERSDGFAQVFPEHKYKIVELLQAGGHIVGMTGDGVNDAPALKKADAGIAVAGATDAAKSAADIVFTRPGISVIIDAIEESRKIFQRMNNYSIYRIAETIRVLIFLTLAILIFNFYPVTAIMIVLIALLNDAPIMTIAYDYVKIARKPVRWNMGEVLALATYLGIIGVFASFILFFIAESLLHLDRTTIQTFMFLKLAVAGHLTIFLTRTGKYHFWTAPYPSGLLFWSAVSTKLLATLLAVYGVFMTPIGWKLAGFVWAYALIAFVITDYLKVYLFSWIDLEKIRLPFIPSGFPKADSRQEEAVS
jgi:H+-transporting ATPase